MKTKVLIISSAGVLVLAVLILWFTGAFGSSDEGMTLKSGVVETQDQPEIPSPVKQPVKKPDKFQPGTFYVVQPGDTLSSIARKFYQRASFSREIFEANKDIMHSPDDIYPGWKLYIPSLKKSTSVRTKTGEGSTLPDKTRPGTHYVVMEDDTLWGIARRFYKDPAKWTLIFEANRSKLPTPETGLKPGWKLFIPDEVKTDRK